MVLRSKLIMAQIIQTNCSSFYSNPLKELKEFLSFSIPESNFMTKKEVKNILKTNCKEVIPKTQKEINQFSCKKDKELKIINEIKIY